jgi:DNA-binding response OmpR family regulator
MPTRRRILCVEDDNDTSFMLTYLLMQEGYEARSVETVEEALEVSRKESFSLYIIDQWFLKGSGTGLCGQIREFDPHTPIIIYSGAVLDSTREESLLAGADAFVAKPDVTELLKAVERLLNY